MTTLNSFYSSANALSNLDQRRWALGAAYRLGEYTRFGYSIAAARALVLAAPQYANGLAAAGLTAAYGAVDDVGGAAFAPTDLSGLLAWWKADSLALANGAPVTSWADSSGNARTAAQATAGNQPVFATAAVNGLPAVTFDGVDDALVTGAFASPTAGATVLVAQNLNRAGAGYKTVITHAAAATWVAPFARLDMRVQSVAAGEAWYGGVQDQSTAPNAVVEGSLPSTGWQVMAFVYDQTNMLLYRNGTQVAVKGRTGTMTSSTFPVYLGNDTSLTNSYQGSIAEILYYDRGLNATELGQVQSYLQAKYAL